MKLYKIISVDDVSNFYHIVFQEYNKTNYEVMFKESFEKNEYEFNENIFLRTRYDGYDFHLNCRLSDLTSYETMEDLINGEHRDLSQNT